ncbi:hypothetical protein B566_EDAN006808 [Ephemera danica]|nr:hypothetical protein B566_EDAN006808 [Ephemera danica]
MASSLLDLDASAACLFPEPPAGEMGCSTRAAGVEEAARRLRGLLSKAQTRGSVTQLLALPAVLKVQQRLHPEGGCSSVPLFGVMLGIVSVAVVVALGLGLHTHAGFARAWITWRGYDLYELQCAVEVPDWMQRACRPPEDCSLCRGLHQVERLADVSPELFEERYAYNGRPVIVTDAMRNWTAPNTFTFDFFKNLYEQSPQPGCQFFPYKTEFRSLRDVFKMSETRAMLQGSPWYVGWSNCDERVARTLRQHYSKPYFLPRNAETKQLDWIFMGSPGYGAHMHVDSVGHGSWQAQLRGSKLWILQPPPECLYACSTLQAVVHKGEIIVLDTNRWYHQTRIVSDEMSITIGAEFD